MAALAETHPTLLDVAKTKDPDGRSALIAEVLTQENPILEDAVHIEGNLPTGHKSTVRSGLPTPTWRKLYGGVQPTKGRTTQVTDSCGMQEAYAEVDKALADLYGDPMAFRLSEDRAHIEGMAQDMATQLIYGSADESFLGIMPRLNDLSAENANQIVDAGGTDPAGNASILLCGWGANSLFTIYPKGSKAGLTMENKGQVTVENLNGDGGRMEAYRTHYRNDMGLVMKDWRFVGRIANIDVSALTTDGTAADRAAAQKALITYMIMLSERVKRSGARMCWYVPAIIRENLRLGILEKVASNLSWESVEGKRVMTFDDIPVKRVDAMLATEARVV